MSETEASAIHLKSMPAERFTPGPESAKWMARRANAVPRSLGAALPAFVSHAHGAVIEDIDGNRFLDFAGGIGCLNAGHTPEGVTEAIQQQSARFLHTCFMVTPYLGYVELAEELNRRAPGDFAKKTLLANSGAEAVENAIKIARAYTGRQAVIAFEDAFHGRTLLTMSLTSKTSPYKASFGPFAPEIYRMPYAYCYRCSYNLTYPACKAHCASRLEDVFLKQVAAKDVAAVIFEPVLGEGGFVPPPKEWFDTIAAICRKHGIVIIADEVQTGFGRTGATFACERFGLVPDLIVMAKSLSSGMPLGAVTGRAEIMDAPGPGQLGGTFGGNPVSCAAALATLKVMDESNLNDRAMEFGRVFERRAQQWKQRFAFIGDVRGLGAMQALELVTDRATRAPAKAETEKVLAYCHARGLLIISAGVYGNVVRLLAPLVATDAQIEEGLSVLEAALDHVNREMTAAAR
jgi:4-aminobutyrate aminotransferase/(S)-3-amino-2-methylpropionate transaminase